MEYVVGSLVTLICCYFILNKLDKQTSINKKLRISYTQSRSHQILKPFYPLMNMIKPTIKTQSLDHYNKTSVKVIISNDQAYWIRDGQFFVADIIDGIIDQDSTKIVDTMSMDKIQLEHITFIVEKLTEEDLQ